MLIHQIRPLMLHSQIILMCHTHILYPTSATDQIQPLAAITDYIQPQVSCSKGYIQPLISYTQINLWCNTHRSHLTSRVILTDHIQPLKAYSQIISILWCHTHRSHPASTLILTDNIQPLMAYSQIISNLQCQIHK